MNKPLKLFFSILLFTASLSACTGIKTVKSRQGIAFFNLPKQARVYIDGKYMGIGLELNRRPIKLTPGEHAVLIDEPDHYPYFSKFKLEKKVLLKRRIMMRKKLDE
ncbi:MAG: hypothetical protein PF689_04085 [Deltaproteobacteria bacterium]|jgi:hypothetical protein|nr:hypothetical protein [Deltaproteobacteria bacterium]